MQIDWALRKLWPLMPDRVRQWRRELDLVDPPLRVLLEKQIIASAHQRLGGQWDRLLLSLPPKHLARGPLRLGAAAYDGPRWPFGISNAELLQHLGIFGRSGAGKTNLVFHVLLQLSKRRVPWVFLDWKRTARHLLPQLPRRARVFTPGRSLAPFPFNPFVAPPGLEASVYASQVIDVMAAAYTLGDGARSILQKALRSLREQKAVPTIGHVQQAVEAVQDKERVRGWKISVLRALEAIGVLAMNTERAGQEQMVSSLMGAQTILELDALSPSNKKFLAPLLALWLYHLHLPMASREQLRLVLIVEEAHNIFYQHRNQHETVMEMLLRQCREIGIGVVIVDQSPALISSSVLANSYTTICMNLKSPTDIRKAADLSLIQGEDRAHLSRLPVGHGVVKLQDRWREPFLIQVPLVPVKKGSVTDETLRGYLRRERTLSGLRSPVPLEFAALGRSRHPDEELDTQGRALLDDIQRHSTSGVSLRYQRLGWSADKGHRIKKELLRLGLVEEETVAVGRTRKVQLRVTRQGQRFTSEVSGGRDARESITHAYWKHWYASALRARGFAVTLEAPRGKGKMDILATKASERVAIEIETGASNSCRNVREDLLLGCTKIIVAATSKKAQDKVEVQVARAGLLLPQVHIVFQAGGLRALGSNSRL